MLTGESMRAAAVQLNSGPDPEANLAAADRHVRAAAADGATLAVPAQGRIRRELPSLANRRPEIYA